VNKAQGTSSRIVPSRLRGVLLLNLLEQRLRRTLVVQQNPADRILPAGWQHVGIKQYADEKARYPHGYFAPLYITRQTFPFWLSAMYSEPSGA
jgi:hypothetical protein